MIAGVFGSGIRATVSTIVSVSVVAKMIVIAIGNMIVIAIGNMIVGVFGLIIWVIGVAVIVVAVRAAVG